MNPECLKKIIGRTIKEARQRKCIYQKQLAREIGISPISLSHYEQGHNIPSFDMGLKIFQILEIDMDEFQAECNRENRA